MNWDWTLALSWLVRTAVGGSLLLLLVWALGKAIRQPARRQRLAEAGVVAALTLGVLNLTPSWLVVPLPVTTDSVLASSPARGPSPAPADGAASNDGSQLPTSDPRAGHAWLSPVGPLDDTAPPEDTTPYENRLEVEGPPVAEVSSPSASHSLVALLRSVSREELAFWLIAIYLVGVTFGLGRWLLGSIGLWRLLRSSVAPPAPVARLFATMTRGQSRRPRLRMSCRLHVPVSCGLIHPTVVLPANLCESGPPSTLRWVFTHELTHLRRGDAWSGLLFALGGAVFFYCPWFWWLRRQVRLCQEYIADAGAVDEDARTEDYAQFLLNLASVPAGPALAIGVSGHSSDLFRRITMLLHAPTRVERHCPRPWALATAAALLAVAVLASGIRLQAAAPVTAGPDQTKQTPAAADPTAAPKDGAKQEALPAGPGGRGLATRFVFSNNFQGGTDAIEALQKALDGLPKGPEAEKAREALQKAIDRIKERRNALPAPAVGRFGGAGGAAGLAGQLGQRGRLGARVEAPSAALADQLDLPKGMGMVINQVVPDSPAAKAGLKAHDILLELNGQTVPSNAQEFVRMVHEIKPETPVAAVVLRKGRKETIKGLSLPEEPAVPPAGAAGNAPFGGRPGLPRVPGAPATVPIPANPALPGAAPVVPVPAAPGFPGGAGGGWVFGGPNTVFTSVWRNNDRFTTRHQEGNLVITVTGTVTDGKGKVSEIHVHDGTESSNYKSVDKVPERYRDKVKNLVEMSEKGQVKVETKNP